MSRLRRILKKLSAGLSQFRFPVLPLILLLILMLALAGRWWQLAQILPDQQAAERWQGESSLTFCQVSCFVPELLEAGQINSFRSSCLKALADAGITETAADTAALTSGAAADKPAGDSTAVGSRAWSQGLMSDALSCETRLQAAGSYDSRETAALAVNCDWCSFHQLQFCSGSPFSSADISHDRVLLSESLAFHLFGSVDAAGLTVELAGLPYQVAGVFKIPERPLLQSLTADPDLLIFWQDQATVLETASPIKCCCYEYVLAEPYQGFALQQAQEAELFSAAEILENSGRFRPASIWRQLWSFPQRVVRTRPLSYPSWENAARIIESHLLAVLTLIIISLLTCAAFIAVSTVRQVRKAKGAADAADHPVLH